MSSRISIYYLSTQDEGLNSNSNTARVFALLLTMYMYSSASGTFCPVPTMPTGVPLQVYNAKRALQLISEGTLVLLVEAFIVLHAML